MTNSFIPNTASIPNILFDYWMRKLTDGEFKVLMAIARKTYGWRKKCDTISLRQIEHLTSLSRKGITKMIDSLCSKNLVIKIKSKTEWGDDAPNQYEININCETPLDENCMEVGRELSTLGVGNSVHHGGSVLSTPTKDNIYTKSNIQKEEGLANARPLLTSLKNQETEKRAEEREHKWPEKSVKQSKIKSFYKELEHNVYYQTNTLKFTDILQNISGEYKELLDEKQKNLLPFYILALIFFKKLKLINACATEPKFEKWAKTFQSLSKDAETNTPEEIEKIIEYYSLVGNLVSKNGFSWGAAIASADSFRKNFPQLWKQASQEKEKKVVPEQNEEWACIIYAKYKSILGHQIQKGNDYIQIVSGNKSVTKNFSESDIKEKIMNEINAIITTKRILELQKEQTKKDREKRELEKKKR